MKLPKFISFLLLVVSMAIMFAPATALAQETPTPTPEPTPTPPSALIEVLPTYPKVEAIAGSSFSFEVQLRYTGGDNARVFDLRLTGPTGWELFMTPQYQKDNKISAIRLEPAISTGTTILVTANAPFYPLPDPGSYKIKLEAISDKISGSADLTAQVTAKYILILVPAIEGRYNTTAEAGKESTYSIKTQNLGTAPIDKINLSSTKPDGWTIEFSPDKVDTLGALDEKSIDVKIKPAPKTIAGDYMISLNASGSQTTAQKIDIRVTVESPSVWGWVGVGIILVVVVGLVYTFARFSRR